MKFGAGQSVKRVEDARLLTGQGRFTDDLQRENMAFAVTLRSPYAHAEIRSIDMRNDGRPAPVNACAVPS